LVNLRIVAPLFCIVLTLHIAGLVFFSGTAQLLPAQWALANNITVELLSPTPHPTASSPKACTAKPADVISAKRSTAPSAVPTNETSAMAATPTHAVDSTVPRTIAQPNCVLNPPAYPPLSRRYEETGTALISITIDKHGVIESAIIKQSSGFKRLDQAAQDAALGGQCRPWLENGQPVRTTSDIPFIFKLEG